ncbi:MAG: formylglycine-generating enzyme family protein [Gammaproteobacteria bacterium]|nr:formylglycine-generating enzyme family protein [Gammaproteobacteria bacterium]
MMKHELNTVRLVSLLIIILFHYQAVAKDGPPVTAKEGMVLIPSGEFIMGSNKVDDETNKSLGVGNAKPWYVDEHPERKINLPAYYIDKYEVTNKQYKEYVKKAEYSPPTHWIESGYILSMKISRVLELDAEKLRTLVIKVFKLDIDTRKMSKEQLIKAIQDRLSYMDTLPVIYVNWYDANGFCKYTGGRLPTEQEWEKAARGSNGNEFVWGNEWKVSMSNTGDEEWGDGIAPVGSYKTDISSYKVADLAGNVSEWVDDWYQSYPGSDYKSNDFGKNYKVLRGAAWGREGHYAISLFQRGAYRFDLTPQSVHADLGFRCAKDAS